MNEIINKLADLYRQREAIDKQIKDLIGIIEESESLEQEEPKKERRPKKNRETKPRKIRKKRTGDGGILRRYRCQDCALGFESDAEYRDVRCPACVSKNVLSLPSGSDEDE